ncbi:hypothetical protein NDN08_007221 [Rhodosorus marinus]|uniref:C2H2-type domain-containing protein n=1 Tax=Rhodosorus marinus TaxID=101924 RepID=A0AAV8UFW2_9RHOD|nr:hypothetical protein NDN08_007221 [Rhodosorus marinus]
METPYSSQSEHLVWDSMPMNWSLFKTYKLAAPQPSDWGMLLLDMQIRVPEATGAVLASSEIMQMVGVLQQPALMMTEYICDSYALGSGWAFLGGLPELNGVENTSFMGLQRFRFMSFVEGGKMATLSSAEVGPGTVAFVKAKEVDARHNATWWGIVDKEKETILEYSTSVTRRACEECRVMVKTCDPRTCASDVSSEDLWHWSKRKELKDHTGLRKLTLEYTQYWHRDSWAIYVGPLEPLTISLSQYSSGPVFQIAHIAVVQDEVLGLHPPRSSFRTVKYARDLLNYPDGLEVGKPSSAIGVELLKPAGSSESGSSSADAVSAPASLKGLCEICGAKFKRKYEARRHRENVHEKLREHQCELCERTFSQKGHLNEHIRVIHSEQSVNSCTICGKRFGVKSKMERHVATVHENRRSFQCEVCKKWYKEKGYLKRHLRVAHELELSSEKLRIGDSSEDMSA